MNPHPPIHRGHGAHGWAESSFSIAPIFGGFLLLLLLLALIGLYLWRQGKLTLPKFGGSDHRRTRPSASSPNASLEATSTPTNSWSAPA